MKRFLLLIIILVLLPVALAETIDLSPPQIVNKEPTGTISTTETAIELTTSENATCKISSSDKAYENMSITLATINSIDHEVTLDLSNGNHTYYARCRDANDNIMTTSEEVFFWIDTLAPEVTEYEPFKSGTASTNLKIYTDEDATCKYSTTEGLDYSVMEQFDETSMKDAHTTVIQDLEEGMNYFYIKCKDEYENTATSDYEISIKYDPLPVANIELEENPPLGEGTYKVNIQISNLVLDPELWINFNKSKKSLVLSGSGQDYAAYIDIGDVGETIAWFTFKAETVDGRNTTETSGDDLFLVDTDAPLSPRNIEVLRQVSGDVRITFDPPLNEDENNIKEFVIYRRLSENVSYDDEYKRIDFSEGKSYRDTKAKPYETYHYRFQTVDKAGNEGTLSDEYIAHEVDYTELLGNSTSLVTSTNQTNETGLVDLENLTLTDSQLIEQEDAIKEIEAYKKEVEDYEDSLSEKALIVFKILDLSSKQSEIKKELDNLKKQIEEIEPITFDTEIKTLNKQAFDAKNKLPKKLEATSSKTSKLQPTKERFELVMADLGWNENKLYKDAYKHLKKIQTAEYGVTLTSFDVEIAGKSETYIFVEKEFKDNKAKYSIEYLPKTVAESVTALVNPDFEEVLKEDSVVLFKTSSTEEVQYLIKSKNSKLDPTEFLSVISDTKKFKGTMSGNKMTGNFVSSITDGKFFIPVLVLVIAAFGALGYYFLMPSKKKNNQKIISRGKPKVNVKTQGGVLNSITSVIFDSFAFVGDLFGFAPKAPKPRQTQGQRPISGNQMPQAMGQMPRTNFAPQATSALEMDYPNHAKQEYEKLGLVSLEDNKAEALTNQAHDHIDNLNFDDANKIYYLLLTQHKNFEIKNKRSFMQELNSIYTKLNLFITIHQIEASANKGDFLNLKHLLNKAASTYNVLLQFNARGSTLLDLARDKHEQYSTFLANNLK
jgi:hypothetical protein